MTEREYVLQIVVRQARRLAGHYGITTQPVLVAFMADYCAASQPGGSGPARDDIPAYQFATHRRGVWIGRMAHMHEGPPAIRWPEVAALALGEPRQGVLL